MAKPWPTMPGRKPRGGSQRHSALRRIPGGAATASLVARCALYAVATSLPSVRRGVQIASSVSATS